MEWEHFNIIATLFISSMAKYFDNICILSRPWTHIVNGASVFFSFFCESVFFLENFIVRNQSCSRTLSLARHGFSGSIWAYLPVQSTALSNHLFFHSNKSNLLPHSFLAHGRVGAKRQLPKQHHSRSWLESMMIDDASYQCPFDSAPLIEQARSCSVLHDRGFTRC